jgi:hypothetical protein
MLLVRFHTLTGKFASSHEIEVSTVQEALAAAKAYAEPYGFTGIKIVEGEDPYDGIRITGRTPGGRPGRNIASIDPL